MAQYWSDHSLQFAIQDDLPTPSSVAQNLFATILCERPTVRFDTASQEVELNKGQIGAAPELIVGRRSGTLSFRQPLESFKDGYDATAENPGGAPVGSVEVIPPWMILAANALGCNVEALAGATITDKNTNFWRGTFLSNTSYAANAVTAAGTNSTNIQGDAAQGANHKAGQLICAATSAVIEPFLGFTKTKLVDLMTTFEAAQAPTANYDDNGAEIFGTATAWLSDDQPRALTCYWTGPNTAACYVLTGLVCESWKLAVDENDIASIEFTFRFYDFQMDKTKGGLVTPDAYERQPALVGNNGGALMLNAAHKCGFEDFAVEWSGQMRELRCFGASQGVNGVTVVKQKVRITCSVPHDADNDVVYDAAGAAGNTGSHQWQSSLELGTRHSIGVYVGPAAGRCLALLMPSGRITATPSVSDRDGIIAYQLQLDADTYSADSTDTAETSSDSPIDSIFRLALA